LNDLWATAATKMQTTEFLQLHYGPGRVVEPFLRRLFAERNPRNVYWVSPWLTHMDFKTATTKKLFQKLQSQGVNLVIITREPEAGSLHDEFIRDAKQLSIASIFYMPLLHAKFYLTTTLERRYALLGSANMYEWSNRSYELGIVIEARGDGEVLVDKLEELAIELRLTQYTQLVHRRHKDGRPAE
jgi:hypothetical protein